MNLPDSQYLLVSNLMHFVVCIFIVVYIRLSLENQTNSHSRFVFKRVIYIAILGLFFDMASYIFDTQRFTGAKLLSHTSMFLSVFLTVFLGYVCNKFYDVTFRIKPSKRRMFFYLVPVVLIFVLLIANIFTGWFFSIDKKNVYTRGPAAFLSFALQYILFIVLGIRAIIFKLPSKTIRYLKLRNAFIWIGLLSFVFGLGQLIAGGKIALFCFGITISLLVMFSRFQDDQITNDSLTGLNNRYSLDNYLSDKFKIYFEGIRGKEKLYLIMMDINLFKQINDKYGHTEGDRALKLVASTLKEIGGKYEKLFLARFGGDEFVAVYETVNDHRVNELCVDIKENVKKAAEVVEYPLEIGVGYALYRGKSMTLTELYNVADIALYQDKDKMKKGDAN